MKFFINIEEIKRGYSKGIDHFCAVYDNIIHPDFASIVAFSIVTIGVCMTFIVISSYNLEEAVERVKIEKIQQLNKEEQLRNIIAMKKIENDYLIKKMEHDLRIAEIHAATNPYVIEAQHSVSPVNVFINTNYTIDTADGVTEIAVSMITVNNRTYTPEQRKLLTMAFYIGQEIGYPETVQSLLLQETRAGAYGDRIGDTNLPIGKRSYGVMQMKVGTARKVLKKYKNLIGKYFPRRKTYKRLRDEEIIIKLIQDDEFNIRLATLNFNIHRKLSRNWALAVVAYNTGQGKANTIAEPKKHIYYGHILKKMISEVRPFNKETKLTL